MDFCTNKITRRYPMQSYCSNLECEELWYILEGKGTIHKINSEPIEFNKGDIIFINKKDSASRKALIVNSFIPFRIIKLFLFISPN